MQAVDARMVLTGALRACAAGLYPLEAGTELLISNGTFLHRDDFTSRFITCGHQRRHPMAAIDWDAAITALASGGLPCSGGERRIFQLAASLAADTPASLRATPSPATTTTTPPATHRNPPRVRQTIMNRWYR